MSMFSFLKPPLERRMFALIWPRTEEVRAACPPGTPSRAHPIVIQATTAIPNLSIAATLLFQALPREKAQTTTAKIEALMFELIGADQADHYVSDILRLESEQKVWLTQLVMLGVPLGSGSNLDTVLGQSNLDTILRVVCPMRIEQYQQECRKGFLMATNNAVKLRQYGPLGFLAKRVLSDMTGHPVLREDDLSEEGFGELGNLSIYFTDMFNRLAEEMRK